MIRGRYLNVTEDLSDVISIRKSVLGIGNDDDDSMAMHALVFDDDLPVASGRMRFDGETFTMDLLAVLDKHRNQGFGEFTLRLLADKVLVSGGKEIFLSCEKQLATFFEKYEFKIYDKKDNVVFMKLNLSELKSPCGGHCKK